MGWQTYAWSYGQWDARAQLRQVLNSVSVGGSVGCCDKDVAVAADYGQWHSGPRRRQRRLHRDRGRERGQVRLPVRRPRGVGRFCPGTGCTAVDTANAAKFGCNCVDHKGSGGFCPGSGCTAKETADAAKFGCGCVDHKGAGGFCPGTGCTAHETLDCQGKGQKCSLHACVP